MRIHNFNPIKINTKQSSPKQRNISVNNASVVSFSAISDEQKLANAYYKKLAEIQEKKGDIADRAYKKEVKLFFEKLSNESTETKRRFLEKNMIDNDHVFAQSLYASCYDSVHEILNLYQDADEKVRTKFLLSHQKGVTSPFLLAAEIDSNIQIGNKLRKLLKTISPEKRGEFFYHRDNGLFGFPNTIIDELKDTGYLLFVKGLETDKTNFDKEFPQIAAKMRKKYPEFPNENQYRRIKPETEKKVSETPKNSKFRVYENVKTRFSDVGGMFNVKKQIKEELLNILNNPKVKNSDKPSGIILYGPPGTGKTLLATAIAGEAGVPFVSTAGSGFNEIYVGAGAKHVRELYSTARELARQHLTKTAIVFIDEADAVASRRGNSSSKENDHTLNALLTELDGVQTKEESDIKVITILATNRKDMFDEAFRKGRIDLEFKIDDPRFSEKARKEILLINAKNKPFENEEEKKRIINQLAQTSSGMSGAELADVIKRAYRKTLYLGRKTPYITEKDISEAKLEAIIGIKNDTEKSDFEQKSVIAHEAGHAINQLIMNKIFANENEKSKLPIQKLDFIVNESRGDAAGLTMMKPSPENNRLTIESLISCLVVKYGGYSIEEEMFDGHTDGVSSDLQSSTNLILDSVTKWGLGSKTKFIGCAPNGLTYELFKSDIKQDILDYSNFAMSISSDISKFVKPFIEEYTEIFLNANADKINIITGEKFEELFNNWLINNKKVEEFEKTCSDIKNKITDFKNRIKA